MSTSSASLANATATASTSSLAPLPTKYNRHCNERTPRWNEPYGVGLSVCVIDIKSAVMDRCCSEVKGKTWVYNFDSEQDRQNNCTLPPQTNCLTDNVDAFTNCALKSNDTSFVQCRTNRDHNRSRNGASGVSKAATGLAVTLAALAVLAC